MAESSVLPVLAVLGGVALAQGVAMIQSWLDRKNKREVLLRTKYEEMGLCFLESVKSPGELMLCATHEETLAATQQTEGNKIHLLALVYFPLLRHATGQYIESYSVLCEVAISLYDPGDKRVLGVQVSKKHEYVAVREAYFAARDHLQDQIEAYSKIYVKA
jgi:hypothetical protein